MVFLYSPLMSNIKFFGHFTSYLVYVSNEYNYFNHIYFGINALLDAFLCSGYLAIVSLYAGFEFKGDANVQAYFFACLGISVVTFMENIIVGTFYIIKGISKRTDYLHI